MRFGLKEEIIGDIIQTLTKYSQVKKAVIFGSRARGDFQYNSDIDLAVFSDNVMPAELYFDIDEAAGIYKIDVLDMATLQNEVLRKKIEDQGIEIFAR